MDISGSYTLYAPRERVWNALLDPQTLKATVPGCESLERESEDTYHVRLNVGVAAVKGLYEGTLRIVEQQAPEHYRMVVSGKGTRGMLHGDGTLHLEARDANTTVVTYAGQAQLGGAIAGVGMRVAGGAANMMIKGYFAKLADTLVASANTPAASGAAAATVAAEVAAPTVAAPAITETLATLVPAATIPAAEAGAQAYAPSVNGATAAPALAAVEQPVAAMPTSSGATAYAHSSTAAASAAGANAAVTPSTPRATPPPPTPRPQRTPLMQIARRSGLTDGSQESEQLWARRLLGAGLVGVALIVVIGAAISQALRR